MPCYCSKSSNERNRKQEYETKPLASIPSLGSIEIHSLTDFQANRRTEPHWCQPQSKDTTCCFQVQSKDTTSPLPRPNRKTGPCCCLCPVEGQDLAVAKAQSKDMTSLLPAPIEGGQHNASRSVLLPESKDTYFFLLLSFFLIFYAV